MSQHALNKAFVDFASALAGRIGTATLKSVTVQSVDDEFAYVTVFDDDTPTAVPLTSCGLPQGMSHMVPNVGSQCVVGFVDGSENTAFFVAMSEVDKFIVQRGKTNIEWSITAPDRDNSGEPIDGETADEVTLTIDTSVIRVVKDLIEFNGGSLGDLVVIQKLTDRLNKMQSEIDTLQNNISSHSHTYIDSVGSGATPTPKSTTATTYTKAQFTQVQNSDYNNEKIKQ